MNHGSARNPPQGFGPYNCNNHDTFTDDLHDVDSIVIEVGTFCCAVLVRAVHLLTPPPCFQAYMRAANFRCLI